MSDIRQWLTDLGLERYGDIFERFEPRPGHLRSLARVKRLLNQSVVDRAREHGNVVLLVQTSRAFSSQRIIHNLCEAIASRQ
jgi:hypothetical protein